MTSIEKHQKLHARVVEKRGEHEDRLADILQDEIETAPIETADSVGQFLARLKEETRETE